MSGHELASEAAEGADRQGRENNGQETLRLLAELAREIGAEGLAEEAANLGARTTEGRSYVAFLGQFKRGKSTLINALIGENVLPTGTPPVTSVVTVVRHGPPAIRVKLAGPEWVATGRSELAAYATEDLNPGNVKGVRAIEVFTPSPLLADGMCFVDTPGLGSVFDANTEATRDFVPHVDGALIVLGADPPITGEEIGLIETIAQHVEHMLFVINKADRVRPDELDAAVRFTRRVLSERLQTGEPPIYRVSATRHLAGSAADPSSSQSDGFDWDRLAARLRNLARDSGRELVAAALHRGLKRLSARLAAMIADEEAALTRPLSDSREHLAALRSATDDAHEALRDMGPLLDAEVARLTRKFETRRDDLVKTALPGCGDELRQRLDASAVRFGPALRRYAFEQAHELAQAQLMPWLRESAREAEIAYRDVATRFSDMAESAIARLQTRGVSMELGLADNATIEAAFAGRSRFQFAGLLRLSSPAGFVPLVRWLADAILPRSIVRKQVEADALRFLHTLLYVNASRVGNDLKQRIQDNRLHLEGRIRVALKEVLRSAERAIEEAQAAQEQGEAAVAAKLVTVRGRRSRLESALSSPSED